MNREKLVLIAKGTIKHLPGVKNPNLKTGGTIESRYCYSVWLRHLTKWSSFNKIIPETIAELGPGDSLGTGLAALLSGAKHLYALDIIKYWDNKRNLEIFEDLITLFKSRADIPDNNEYPKVRPPLEDYKFPSQILTDEILKESLAEERLSAIRKEILDINNKDNKFINYKIPWHDHEVIDNDSIDMIYSQAVLECIEDLDHIYNSIHKWLKPGGLMSHTIDFKSHGLTESWNGHWMFSDLEWNLVKGGRTFLINRQPISRHIELHFKYDFTILIKQVVHMENKLSSEMLSEKYRTMSDEDLTTSGAYILSKK